MRKKSQVSTEYMMIIGFATVISLPLLIIYYDFTSSSRDSVSANQALQIARNIVDASESVYYLGKPSQTILKVNIPNNVESINLSNREVIFKMKTASGINEIVQVSAVNITGSISQSSGIHTITIVASDNSVQISSN
ncbi:MAG TPA: hypothetical protein VI564_04645 [Candidatus Nanoarchaeia archaeon]|nr:hypothetical protein [Candidatus Nanoarchaeia archaeon]